jgi:hypothetical protein
MRKTSTIATALACAAALLAGSPPVRAAEPPISSTGQNLPLLTGSASYQAGPGPATSIRAYRASGTWTRDRGRIAAEATDFLDQWLATCRTLADCRPAVVFDIDETLLSSYATFSRYDFAPTSAAKSRGQARCQQSRISEVAALFAHARELGVAVVIITGRSERSRATTSACLRERGITGWTRLVMRTTAQRATSAASYKASARGSLEGEGYDIALSIGDQFSDVAGGHFAHGFVLPNPMAFIA